MSHPVDPHDGRSVRLDLDDDGIAPSDGIQQRN